VAFFLGIASEKKVSKNIDEQRIIIAKGTIYWFNQKYATRRSLGGFKKCPFEKRAITYLHSELNGLTLRIDFNCVLSEKELFR